MEPGLSISEERRRDHLDTWLYAALVGLGIVCCLAWAVISIVAAAAAIVVGQPWLLTPLSLTVLFVITQLGRIRRFRHIG